MVNNKFWNVCTHGSLREKVAEFIDKSPLLSKLKGDKYYDLEDEIVDFIKQNRSLIADEVDMEYYRDDLATQVGEDHDEEAAKIILSVVPTEIQDGIISDWRDVLSDNDTYWECSWADLSDTLYSQPIFDSIEDYDREALLIYAAYLKEWYTTHDDHITEAPASINEFVNNEMSDDDIAKHYTELAKEIKKGLSQKEKH